MTPSETSDRELELLEQLLARVLIPLLVVAVIGLYVVLALRIAGVIHGCSR